MTIPSSLRSLLWVAASALLTVILIDQLIVRAVPLPKTEYETVDAIRDYRASDPDVLVLGSSHARSLTRLAHWYGEQQPPLRMAIMPIEGGKLYAYDWLLEHRLKGLIDETGADGRPLRPRLRRLVLVTNYWDACGSGDSYPNLPSRAWALRDFIADFARHGSTPHNTNYVDQRWNEFTHGSSLIGDRGAWRIIKTLRQKYLPRAQEEVAETDEAHLARWVAMIEATDLARPDCDSAEQEASLERILKFAKAREIEITILLWSPIPRAQTASTLAVTERYRAMVEKKVTPYGAQILDLRRAQVLANEDYRPDLDHLYPSGHEKIRQWFLAGPFQNLYAELVKGAQP